MLRSPLAALLVATASIPFTAAHAQTVQQQIVSGTRLDIVATGKVTRVPDIARVSAGVITQAPTATAAISQNAQRMSAVIAALKRAGIPERDIQTTSISLHPDYRHSENRSPQLIGYRASNEVTVRFREIANTGKILDALVAQGANHINGPMLAIDRPEEALDEARREALKTARQRAELYAQALGKRVTRIVSISEAGAHFPPPHPVAVMAERAMDASGTRIEPGEQTLSVSLSVSFELE